GRGPVSRQSRCPPSGTKRIVPTSSGSARQKPPDVSFASLASGVEFIVSYREATRDRVCTETDLGTAWSFPGRCVEAAYLKFLVARPRSSSDAPLRPWLAIRGSLHVES